MILPSRPATSLLTAAFLVAGAITASGCGPAAGHAERPPAQVEVAVPLEAKGVREREEFLGRCDSMETVQVQARVFGYLQKILFEDGQTVEMGQPLFEIDPSTYQAIYNQNKAKVEVAKARQKVNEANYARSKNLFDRKAITKEELDEALAKKDESLGQVAEAEADAAKSKLDLDFTKISSPISGRVDRTFVTLGNLVSGGQTGGTTLTRLVSVSPIYVYFEVDDKLSAKYWKILREAKAQKLESSVKTWELPMWVWSPSSDDAPREGYIDFSSTTIDAGSATRQVRGVVENDDRRFTPGQFVTVQVSVTPPYDALSIEGRAVQSDLAAKKFVFVVGANDKVEQRYVELGPKLGGRQIVKSGLKLDDRVIVSGFQRVRPGETVQIVPSRRPSPGEAAPAESAPHGTSAAAPAASPSAAAPVPAETPAAAATPAPAASSASATPATPAAAPADAAPAKETPAKEEPAKETPKDASESKPKEEAPAAEKPKEGAAAPASKEEAKPKE